MGQKDNAQNDYFNDKVRFADACNGILFQGKELIRPEDLQEMDPDIVFYNENDQLQKIVRDKVRMWKGICIGIIGLENQTNVDYHMVFRTMKAEALAYSKQWIGREQEYRRKGLLREEENFEWSLLGKESRFIPVIMIVIYFGTDREWDGARCLYDMLDIDKELEPYVTNYKMNLFDYHEFEDFSFFKTENRLMFETLACSKNKREMKAFLQKNEKEYENLDMTTKMLICGLLGFKNSKIIKKRIEEGMGMCKAILEWEEEAIEKGIEKGTEENLRNLMKSTGKSASQAMDLLLIPKNKRKKYLKALS